MKNIYKYEPSTGIARWKINSPFETFLSRLADKSEFFKSLYVGYYKLFDRKYYKNGLKFIDKEINNYLKDNLPSGKRYKKLVKDMVYCLHRFGISFDEYFLFNFLNLNCKGRANFVGIKFRTSYIDARVNDLTKRELLEDKGVCYNHYKKFFKRDAVVVYDCSVKDELIDLLERKEKVIVKPLKEACGRGIAVFTSDDLKSKGIEFLTNEYKGGCIVEEFLVQNNIFGKINSSSINTIRIFTARYSGKEEVFAAYVRFGRKNSNIDNVAVGGLSGAIDIESGTVLAVGNVSLGARFTSHPDSGEQILGIKIPKWEEAKKFALELMAYTPEHNFIGWDIALVEDEWIMIEGNHNGAFVSLQFLLKEGFKDKLDKCFPI